MLYVFTWVCIFLYLQDSIYIYLQQINIGFSSLGSAIFLHRELFLAVERCQRQKGNAGVARTGHKIAASSSSKGNDQGTLQASWCSSHEKPHDKHLSAPSIHVILWSIMTQIALRCSKEVLSHLQAVFFFFFFFGGRVLVMKKSH